MNVHSEETRSVLTKVSPVRRSTSCHAFNVSITTHPCAAARRGHTVPADARRLVHAHPHIPNTRTPHTLLTTRHRQLSVRSASKMNARRVAIISVAYRAKSAFQSAAYPASSV